MTGKSVSQLISTESTKTGKAWHQKPQFQFENYKDVMPNLETYEHSDGTIKKWRGHYYQHPEFKERFKELGGRTFGSKSIYRKKWQQVTRQEGGGFQVFHKNNRNKLRQEQTNSYTDPIAIRQGALKKLPDEIDSITGGYDIYNDESKKTDRELLKELDNLEVVKHARESQKELQNEKDSSASKSYSNIDNNAKKQRLLDEEKNAKDVGLEGYVNNGTVSEADQARFDKAKAQREKERQQSGFDETDYSKINYKQQVKSKKIEPSVGTIQNFIGSMNKSNGFARTSRYAVVITPPGNLDSLMNTAGQGVRDQTETGQMDEFNGLTQFQSLSNQVGRQVNLHCNSVAMPGHDLQAQDVQHGSAPGRQMVTSHDYNGTIAASFYLDSHLRERHFFEMWQKMAVNKSTHKANYYDDYIGSMMIFQLDGNNEITYGIKATEVYPTTLGGIEYAYANANTIATQSVNFQFRQWFNLTDKTIAGYRNSDSYNLILKTYGVYR